MKKTIILISILVFLIIGNVFLYTMIINAREKNAKSEKKKVEYDDGDIVVLKLTDDTVIVQGWYSGMYRGRSKNNRIIEFKQIEVKEKLVYDGN